jgi:hypothetical protein
MFKAPRPTRLQPKTQRARGATIVERGHFALQCHNPCAHPPLTLSSTLAPPPNPQAKGREKLHLEG